MSESFLSQVSARDDMVFRALLIPVGLFIAGVGIRAIRRRELFLRKRAEPVRGTLAIVLGGVITLTGLTFSVIALGSFFR